jgi:predicted transposase YbfD/YdcC
MASPVERSGAMEAFAAVFEELDDPRTGNAKRHLLSEILVIALCTVASGGETCADMALFGQVKQAFLEQFLTLPYGIPSHDTFSRVFRLLDPAQFRTCFVAFMRRFAEACEGVVAIDGKTLRRSFDAASSASPLHLVSAWACEQRLVLGQLAIDSKSNEITAVPKLLELLTLKGTIVTADALNCQRATAGQIIGQGSDYVLALKGNQGRLFDDVRTFLDDPAAPLTTGHETDAGHGRLEQRRAGLTGDIAWLQERHAWPGLQAIGKVTARREVGGKTTIKTRYYLLSTVLSPERFSQVVRSHWDIENRLHWVLDVVMNEDQARNRKDHGPENLAVLRRLALNLARLEASKGSLRGKLKRAGWDDTFLARLLAQTAQPLMR